MSDPDSIWDRALEHVGEPPPPQLGAGDAALIHAACFDGMAQNGGMLHAVGEYEWVPEAVAAFRAFGLDDIAEAVADVRDRLDAVDHGDEAAVEALELEADDRYHGDDPNAIQERLLRGVEERLERSPEDFAPL